MLDKLQEVIWEYTGDETMEISEETVLISDLGMNSLDLMGMACDLEDKFDIEIPDRDLRNFRTVGDVMEYIRGKK